MNESNALWDGLRLCTPIFLLTLFYLLFILVEYDTFWGANKLLTADINTIKHVPVRVCHPQMPLMQDLVSAKDEKGSFLCFFLYFICFFCALTKNQEMNEL